jgi:hypothetical protein
MYVCVYAYMFVCTNGRAPHELMNGKTDFIYIQYWTVYPSQSVPCEL